MRIGFTYDLRDDYLRQGYSEEDTAEFDAAETIDAIESALRSLGHAVDRIGGVKPLAARLAAGDRWDLVFNYAEGMFGFAREAQVPALLDAFQVPYTFSDGLVFALTLHKGLTKHVVRGLGLPTPDFAVVSIGRRGRARPAAVPAVREARRVRVERRHLCGVARRRAGGAGGGCRDVIDEVPPAGARGDIPARPRTHGRHQRHGRARQGAGRDGGRLHR